MSKGYIYIMTNPALKDMVKIGYATDVEARRKQLSTTALPFEYQVYATYETSGNLEDKKLHSMIDQLNDNLRVSKGREFFLMSPDDAYKLLEAIATISGTKDKLNPPKAKAIQASTQQTRKPPIDFAKCGIPVGAELVFTEDSSVKVTVTGNRKVEYNEVETSVSAVAASLKGVEHIAGPQYFTYNGELLADIARRTQWKE